MVALQQDPWGLELAEPVSGRLTETVLGAHQSPQELVVAVLEGLLPTVVVFEGPMVAVVLAVGSLNPAAGLALLPQDHDAGSLGATGLADVLWYSREQWTLQSASHLPTLMKSL